MRTARALLFVAVSCLTSLLCTLAWSSQPHHRWDHTLLIVNYNHPFYDSIPFLKQLYGKEFPHIVFYGEKPLKDVETVQHHQGWYGQRVLEHAMRTWPHYAGYLMINDDCLINYWNFHRFDQKKIWLVSSEHVKLEENSTTGGWWQSPCGFEASTRAFRSMSSRQRMALERHVGPHTFTVGMADVVYIPHRYRSRFLKLCPAFNEVFLEIGVQTMCATLAPPSRCEKLRATFLWGDDRKKYQEAYSPEIDFLHPVKFSDPACQRFAEERIHAYENR
jgi:hypothetical protein